MNKNMLIYKGGVYKITSPSGGVYIGATLNLKRRKSEYKRVNKISEQYLITSSILKYGFDSHQWEVLFNSDDEEAIYKFEEEAIELYKTNRSKYPNGVGLNLKDGGKSGFSKKLICLDTGVIYNSLSSACEAFNINSGHLSDMVRGNMFNKLNLYYLDAEGQPIIPENNHKPLREANKIRISKLIDMHKRVVIDTVTGIKYNSIKEAAEAIGMHQLKLGRRLRGVVKNDTTLTFLDDNGIEYVHID